MKKIFLKKENKRIKKNKIKNKKYNGKGLIIIVLICMILICITYKKKVDFKEDLMLFTKFEKGKVFEVKQNNTSLKSINLLETIENKTLIKERVAPGTKGNFEIVLFSNENIEYYIKFNSKNSKPKNLVFYVKGINKEFENLEELNNELYGNINKNETKKIHINWEWKYTNGRMEDIQDTQDGINIKKYNFDIYVTGK